MTKCSAFKCGKELDSTKREVYAVRIKKGLKKLPNGKVVVDWDGWRFVCKEHYDLVKSRKLRPNLDLIYGKSKKDKRFKRKIKKSRFKKRKNPTKSK